MLQFILTSVRDKMGLYQQAIQWSNVSSCPRGRPSLYMMIVVCTCIVLGLSISTEHECSLDKTVSDGDWTVPWWSLTVFNHVVLVSSLINNTHYDAACWTWSMTSVADAQWRTDIVCTQCPHLVIVQSDNLSVVLYSSMSAAEQLCYRSFASFCHVHCQYYSTVHSLLSSQPVFSADRRSCHQCIYAVTVKCLHM